MADARAVAGLCGVRAGRFGAATGEAGIAVHERRGFGLASVVARRGRQAALAATMARELALELPLSPRRHEGRGLAAIWAGQQRWLVLAPRESAAGMEALLGAVAGGNAMINDASHAQALIVATGRRGRDMLAKGCAIDLHPRAFAPGDAAMTSIAHIGVHLWRLPDGPQGPIFEIAVARSLAASFWHWLAASGAEWGVELGAPADASRR